MNQESTNTLDPSAMASLFFIPTIGFKNSHNWGRPSKIIKFAESLRSDHIVYSIFNFLNQLWWLCEISRGPLKKHSWQCGVLPSNHKSQTRVIQEKKIDENLVKGLETKQITKEEYQAMKTGEKGPGKIYHLFKVHKDHEFPDLPPSRPIIFLRFKVFILLYSYKNIFL